MEKRRSFRLQNYDYSSIGSYFVTICCYQRECLFGKIQNEQMQINRLGKIVQMTWNDLVNHNSKIELDEFVIMPNHIHGIISITESSRGGFSTRPNKRAALEAAPTSNY